MEVEVHEDRIVVSDPDALFEFADFIIRTGKFEAELNVVCLDPLSVATRQPPFRMNISARSLSSQDGFRRALDNYFGKAVEWGRLLPMACRAAEEAYKSTIQSQDPDDYEVGEARHELIAGVLPEGQLSCLFGFSESAKSLSALAMCLAMNAGTPFVGKPTRSVTSLWLDAENPEITEFAIRKNQLILGNDYDAPGGGLRWMSTKGLSMSDLVPAVRRELEHFNAKVIVVDSAGFVAGGSPIDPEVTIKTCNALLSLKRTILLIAQTTKAEDDRMPFGSTYWHYAIHGKSWFIKGMKKDDEITTGFYLRKSSDGERPKDFAVKFRFDGDMGPITVSQGDLALLNQETGREPDGVKIRRALLEHGKLTAQEIAAETGVAVTNVSPHLTRMKMKGEVSRDANRKWSVVSISYD